MNLVDIFLIAIVLLAAWRGYERGFIGGVTDLVGWFGSLIIAFIIYPYLAAPLEKYVIPNGIMAYGLAFLLSIFLVRTLLALLLNQISSAIPPEIYSRTTNRVLGIVPGLVNGLVYAALASAVLLMFPFSEAIYDRAAESAAANRLGKLVENIEERISHDLGKIVNRPVNKMSIETGSKDFIKLGFTVNDPRLRPDLEVKMLELVNAERIKEGLKPLKADPKLAVVARAHSRDMFARGYFSHQTPEKLTPFDRIRKAHIVFVTAGENLAIAPTLTMAHEGLMKSPGHRANILYPAFGRLGIGVLDGGRYGIMVTQNFRN